MIPENAPIKDIQRLIRLKRYEQPPADYYQQVLEQFRENREAKAAKKPYWKLILEQLNDRLPKIHVPAYAYATIGLFAIVTSAWILTNNEFAQSTAMISEDANTMIIDLHSPTPEVLPRPVEIPSQRFVGTLPPHYVLQSRPSEHDEPFSF